MSRITGVKTTPACSGSKGHALIYCVSPNGEPFSSDAGHIEYHTHGMNVGSWGSWRRDGVWSMPTYGTCPEEGRVVLMSWYGGEYHRADSRGISFGVLLPSLSFDRLEYPETPCAGTDQRMRALVSETGGECEGKGRLEWLGKRTDSFTIGAGGSREFTLPFTCPSEAKDIRVKLVDEIRNGTVGSRLASINPKIPELEVGEFKLPEIPSEVCPGISVAGSISSVVRNCSQMLRGRIVDGETGKVLADFGPDTYSPDEEITMDFSFKMPHRPVPLRAIFQRREAGKWGTIESVSREVGYSALETTIRSMIAPDEFCAGETVSTSIGITADSCPQRIRTRLVDEEAGEEVRGWSAKSVAEGETAEFSDSFEMAWRSMPLRYDVQRYDPVAGEWSQIGMRKSEIAQKKPATGVIVSKEIAEYGRPGWDTSGSCIVKNNGECTGDLQVEGFIAGERMMSESYTLDPGDTRTPTYTATFPPELNPAVELVVSSQRKGRMVETWRETGRIEASRFVFLRSSDLVIRGGSEGLEYAGIIAARDVELEGPMERERREPISFPKRAVPVAFAGRVKPYETDTVRFAEDSVVYLRMKSSRKVSYVSFGRMEDRDTDEVVYSTLEEARPAKPPKLPLPKFFYRRRS